MAIWGRIPVSALPAYVTGQFLGAGAAAGLLVAVWWDVMEVSVMVITDQIICPGDH